jgi:hypothetical protein
VAALQPPQYIETGNQMIYAFIRGYIGGFGRIILDFYLAHNFTINIIVLTYGATIYLAHISYLRAYDHILEALEVKIEEKTGKSPSGYLNKKLDYSRVNWNRVRRTFFFPFISDPRSIAVRIKTNAALRNFFNEEAIKEKLKPVEEVKK